jgi:DNA-binding XRE family transcriptional regulator
MRVRQTQTKVVERNRRIVRVVTERKEMVLCAPVYVSFGEAVKALRIKAGMTQADLSEKVGLSRASIANVETGRQQVLLGDLYVYAAALGVGARTLFNMIEN